jgi:hypothetical protein
MCNCNKPKNAPITTFPQSALSVNNHSGKNYKFNSNMNNLTILSFSNIDTLDVSSFKIKGLNPSNFKLEVSQSNTIVYIRTSGVGSWSVLVIVNNYTKLNNNNFIFYK